MSQENSVNGYVLRISREEFAELVFNTGKYYTGLLRDYKRGTPVIFAKAESVDGKKKTVDCLIGYGVVDKVEMLWEMSPEEEDYCRGHGWKVSLTLKGAKRFIKPLPIKESALKTDKRRGAFLHGAKLTEETIDGLLEQAEQAQETAKNGQA